MKLRENIRIIFQIFKRDLLRLLHNPLAIVVVLGVCLMPSLYAWYTIAANWDPYERTDAIKVAIVNEDEGADNEYTGHLDVGEEVVGKLKENHTLGWQFVSEEQAKEGVESGEYYAAIVIPKEFSADFLSIFSGHFTRPTLDYYINEKISAVVPKITDTGATTIENQINTTFVDTVSKAVVDITQKAGVDIEKDSEEVDDELSSGIARTSDAINQTRTALEGLAPTFQQAQQTISDSKTTLGTIIDAMPGLENDLENAKNSLESMRESVATYGTEISSQITTAATAIGDAAASANLVISRASAATTQIAGNVNSALSAAQQVLQQNQSIINMLQPYVAQYPDLQTVVSNLEAQNQQLQQTVTDLQTLSNDLATATASTEQSLTAINNTAEQASADLTSGAATLEQTILPEMETSLDDFAEAIGTLRGICIALEPSLQHASSTLDTLSNTLTQAEQATSLTIESLTKTEQALQDSLTDLEALSSSAVITELSEFMGLNASEIGEFMAKPVELKTIVEYPVKNYGSGVAPFYTNLALWVAGFILVAILHLWVDPKDLPRFTVTQAYLGRWLMFMALGIFQGFIVCVGDLVLGIQCDNPAAFIFAGLVTVFVDVNIMYALVFTMRHIGRAIGVVVLIMQIPGSSGEYPVEMMPPFFQFLHPLLPFTYSIDAMREAIGGMYDGHYWMDLAALIPFLVIAIAFGLIAGRYAFNINALFDHKLSKTELFICEAPGTLRERFRLRAVIATLLDTTAYRDALHKRLTRFQRNYPRLILIGWIAVAALPALTLALAFAVHADNETKAVLLVCMVMGIFAVGVYLIVVEYLNASLAYQLQISSMSTEELQNHYDRSRFSGQVRKRAKDLQIPAIHDDFKQPYGRNLSNGIGSPQIPNATGAPVAPNAKSAPQTPDTGKQPQAPTIKKGPQVPLEDKARDEEKRS